MSQEPTTDQMLDGLRTSVGRLRALVEPFDDAVLASPAYPSAWTIAQVLSHIGSGAVILHRRLDDGLAGLPTPDDFAPSVWDEWNAKIPRDQADSALVADAAFLARLDSVSADEREGFSFAMGPMRFDLPGFIGLRVNEHAFHTWDIAVALDPAATIPADLAALVVDRLQLVAQYTAKAEGPPATVAVRTMEPERAFTLKLGSDGVALQPGASAGDATLDLPAEAFARLVYGRFDPDHSPASLAADPTVERLRRTFPGP